MKRVFIEDSWPESWKESFSYDLEEVYGKIANRGYAYAYENRRRQTFRLITAVLPTGSKVLDIAAAQGNFSLALAEMGYQVTWNDLREELADYVKLKYEFGSLTYAPGNALDLDFKHEFDAVLITEIIEHVAHPDQFLAKVAQLVRPGGFVVMTTPNGAYFRNTLPKFSEFSDPSVFEAIQFRPNSDGHIFLLHPDEIWELALKAGLVVDEMTLYTNSLTNGHMKTAILLRYLSRTTVERIESFSQVVPVPLLLRERLMVHLGVRFQKPAVN